MRKISTLFFAILSTFLVKNISAQSTNIIGPSGSGQFGFIVTVLPNGNYVVVDYSYDEGATTDVGAVYLYNGSSHALISTLKGSTANDQVGNAGITVLSNGNFVVRSTIWDNGAVSNAGAVTWGSATTGVNGIVSSSNSLVGSTASDQVGGTGLTTLSNGNYIVRSNNWDNGAVSNAGAVTWCNGTTGTSGTVSSSNSLVGSTASDQVGNAGITILSNGNYVVRSNNWDNGAISNAGAVTWGNGTTGISGTVSSSNSLVGSTANDPVGGTGITALGNGNYLVISSSWDNGAVVDAGAVTWANGTTGISGTISSSNSLVGSTASDQVGATGVTVLSNDNYVVRTVGWNNGAIADVGAITWGNGTTGIVGTISSSNSLIGSTASDQAGGTGITALSNGNYVVRSNNWDNGAIINAGAVTWGNGTTGIVGPISSSNSLVGSKANDQVGSNGITLLNNGNYLITSSVWDNGAFADAGAVTWANGATGIVGTISSSNSLVGSVDNDRVGVGGITTLNNGNYVVMSINWNNGAISNTGAVTWGNGTTGIVGTISSSNSLIGSTVSDQVGNGGVTALSNGNYVVKSLVWDNGAIADAGAVTWANGTTGIVGTISSSNSLVGSSASDNVGIGGIYVLNNNNYVVRSYFWDNGAISNAGAVTWANGSTGIVGTISSSNSLIGSTTSDQVGGSGVISLSSGNYVAISSNWDNGSVADAGAITWGNGSTGTNGTLNSSNSLVGSTASDLIGSAGVIALSNGNYVATSNNWDNLGFTVNSGAVSWGNGSVGVTGPITTCNSVTGQATSGGSLMVYAYNSTHDYLIVGRPSDNIVTIYRPTGMSLANTLDATTVTINGSSSVPLITSSTCRIIATLTANGASPVNGSVTAKAWIESSVPTYGGQPFVARHYEITPATNPATATGRITLYFTQQEFDNFNAHAGSIYDLPSNSSDATGKANLRIAKYPGTSNNGSGLPGTYSSPAILIDPNDADIVWNNNNNRWEISIDVTGFSGFIVQTYLNVLPLTLLEFNGKLFNGNAVLNWKTENEQRADKFIVERSIDGRNYSAIGSVNALNRAGSNDYNFTDASINSLGVALVYYRLQQKDIDGRFVYSNIIALTLDNKNLLILYPNPVHDKVNVTVSSNRTEQVKLSLIDNAGRVIQQQVVNVSAGSMTMSIDVTSLAKGMYYLELKGEMMNERKQFVRQ